MKKRFLKKWIILGLALTFICASATSALAWGDWFKTKFGGCFKKSEVMYSKCAKIFEKKVKTAKTLEDLITDDQLCVNKSRNFLLKCRLDKGKLKEGVKVTPKQVISMLSILNLDGVECRKELLMGCGKKHMPNGRKEASKKQVKTFVKCVNKGIVKCDQDAQENKLLEKYISIKAEKSQKKKKKK